MKSRHSSNARNNSRVCEANCAGKHAVVFGAGNIGSHLIPLLARLPAIARLTIVDFDGYENQNRQSQAITPADVNQGKARVQARCARQINPNLEVVPLVSRLENIPLGRLRGDILLACLDSKQSRRAVNEIAWRLGVPWIDAGVEASSLLARVNTYSPGLNQPCLECAWGDRDYATQDALNPCEAGKSRTPGTNSPAYLGALSAALQAVETHKLLSGETRNALIGRQVLVEAATHKHFVTSFRRNPACRFDHAIWKISRPGLSPQELSIGDALKLGNLSGADATLGFGGVPLVKRLDCPHCGFSRRVFRLQSRLRKAESHCPRCDGPMLSAGFYMKTQLSRSDLGPADADRSLQSLGLLPGDILSLTCGADEHFFELGPGPASRCGNRRPAKGGTHA